MLERTSLRALVFCGACMVAAGASASGPVPSRPGSIGSSAPWACHTQAGAVERRRRVEQGFLPQVVFVGETQPTTVSARLAHYKVPAMSVAAIRQGKLDWTAAWGEVQVGGDKAECSSLFQAGSLSKPVTVLAAMRMKAQGRIEFDRNIDAYLSSYHLPAGKQTDTHPVTFRNLFRHTAGLTPGGYEGYAQGQPMPTVQQTVSGEAPSNVEKLEVLNTPDAGLDYSGGGYTVAQIALQDTFHQPYASLMREWVLAPVGMRQADFTVPLPAASRAGAAHGYQVDGQEVPGGWNNYPEQSAAGLWATPSDMAAFLIEIYKGSRGESRVFSQASIQELMAHPIEGHAYGFRLITGGDQVFLTHYGGTVGYRAGMTINLQTGNGAVYLINSDNGIGPGLEFFGAMAREYGWPTFLGIDVTRATQPPAVLQSLVGDYVFAEQGWKVSAVVENGLLTLVFPNGDRYGMAPIQGDPLEFIHPDSAVRASFKTGAGEPKIHLYGQVGVRQAAAKP